MFWRPANRLLKYFHLLTAIAAGIVNGLFLLAAIGAGVHQRQGIPGWRGRHWDVIGLELAVLVVLHFAILILPVFELVHIQRFFRQGYVELGGDDIGLQQDALGDHLGIRTALHLQPVLGGDINERLDLGVKLGDDAVQPDIEEGQIHIGHEGVDEQGHVVPGRVVVLAQFHQEGRMLECVVLGGDDGALVDAAMDAGDLFPVGIEIGILLDADQPKHIGKAIRIGDGIRELVDKITFDHADLAL